jgi:hypothetical protein
MLQRRLVLGGVLVSALLAAGLLFAEQQPTTKGKGKLPLYWNKIGLSDEQRKKVSAISAEYKVKIDALKTEISKLEDEEKQEMGKVLTDAQREQLKRIIASKALSEVPEDKKPSDAKKPKDEKKSGDK